MLEDSSTNKYKIIRRIVKVISIPYLLFTLLVLYDILTPNHPIFSQRIVYFFVFIGIGFMIGWKWHFLGGVIALISISILYIDLHVTLADIINPASLYILLVIVMNISIGIFYLMKHDKLNTSNSQFRLPRMKLRPRTLLIIFILVLIISLVILNESRLNNNPEYYMAKARKHLSNYNNEKAIKFAKKVITTDPQNYDACFIIGKSYSSLGIGNVDNNRAESDNYFSEAIWWFNKALEIKPDDLEALYALGYVYTAKGDRTNTIECYEYIADINPSHRVYCLLIFNSEDIMNSIKYHEKAIKLDPNDNSTYRYIGDRYSRMGAIADAINYYKSALEVNPKDTEILMRLAFEYGKLGMYVEGYDCLQRAARLGDKISQEKLRDKNMTW